jgi:hypothetical protein
MPLCVHTFGLMNQLVDIHETEVYVAKQRQQHAVELGTH